MNAQDIPSSKVEQLLGLLAKQAMILLGISIVILFLSWPGMLLSFVFRWERSPDLLLSSSTQFQMAMMISAELLHLTAITLHPLYLNINRRMLLPIRTVIPILLMMFLPVEIKRKGGPTWYRPSGKDAASAVETMGVEEKEKWRDRLLGDGAQSSSSAGSEKIVCADLTTLLLNQFPRRVRFRLRKKIKRCYEPRKITCRSSFAEEDLTIDDLRLMYKGQARKIRSLRKKGKLKEPKQKSNNANCEDNENPDDDVVADIPASLSSQASLTLDIIYHFLQRVLVLFLCPNALLDRYYDANGKYCALAFSYILNSGVHFAMGYFCLESEEHSGIWQVNFCRAMLRGFICDLCNELDNKILHRSEDDGKRTGTVDGKTQATNRQHYNKKEYIQIHDVHFGPGEDYTKQISGAIPAHPAKEIEKIHNLCPLSLFQCIPERKNNIDQHFRSVQRFMDIRPVID